MSSYIIVKIIDYYFNSLSYYLTLWLFMKVLIIGYAEKLLWIKIFCMRLSLDSIHRPLHTSYKNFHNLYETQHSYTLSYWGRTIRKHNVTKIDTLHFLFLLSKGDLLSRKWLWLMRLVCMTQSAASRLL